MTNRREVLTSIATQHISNINTLETRKSDRLDFHDVAVWEIAAALDAAFEAGFKHAMDHMPAVCNDCQNG